MLVEKVDEPKKDGEFQVADVQDNFVYKGKIVAVGSGVEPARFDPGDIIVFAKYSPDIHEVEVDGKKMKIISIEDILAIE